MIEDKSNQPGNDQDGEAAPDSLAAPNGDSSRPDDETAPVPQAETGAAPSGDQPDVLIPPFKPGDEIIINGRYLVLHSTTPTELVFRYAYGKQVPPGAVKKAFMLGDQFEWNGWAFIITRIVPPLYKRNNKKKVSNLKRHFELHARPFAVRRSEVSKSRTPNREDLERAEEFIGPILEKLSPPTDHPPLASAWAEGVEAFFSAQPLSANPFGSLLMSPHETPLSADVRQMKRRFWETGWNDAQRAAREALPPDAGDDVEQRGQLAAPEEVATGGSPGTGKTRRIIEMGMEENEVHPLREAPEGD